MRLYENLTQKPLLFTYKSLRFFYSLKLKNTLESKKLTALKTCLRTLVFSQDLGLTIPNTMPLKNLCSTTFFK